jgi:anti-anti-sigma regulatory factor
MSHDPLADLAAIDGDTAGASSGTAPATDGDTLPAAASADVVLVLPSSLLISDVGELYPDWLAHLQRGKPLVIDAGAVELVDGAGLQLLAALVKSAAEGRIGLSWREVSPALRTSIDQLGLASLLEAA